MHTLFYIYLHLPHSTQTLASYSKKMLFKQLSFIQILQLSFLALLSLTILLHATISTTSYYTHLISSPVALSCAICAILYTIYRFYTRPRPVLLLNYSCYKPPPHRKSSFEVSERFVLGSDLFAPKSIDFMRNIYLKSGIGNETYGPPFIFESKFPIPTLEFALKEAREGIFSAVDSVFSKKNVKIAPEDIDVVIVTCGSFTSVPSLSSEIVNRYKLRPDVKTYNLTGMGCSAGVLSVDMASRILRTSGKIQNALVVISENTSSNWYFGDNRSMLVTNCIFRVGCASAILTNDPSRRRSAKMELVHSLRTHHGSDDSSYRAAFQEEDENGFTGISLTKDLIRVAGVNLRQHIKILAPRVLPLSQLVQYAYSVISAAVSGGDSKPFVPDFSTAFEHICIHTGGKAVIEQVARVLRLGDEVTEPARMSLHRFGNTSSSLVFYELAYFEAKGRVKRNDRMWMLAFGTGFKVGSLVWKCLKDSSTNKDYDNPWSDCIDQYPVKSWGENFRVSDLIAPQVGTIGAVTLGISGVELEKGK